MTHRHSHALARASTILTIIMFCNRTPLRCNLWKTERLQSHMPGKSYSYHACKHVNYLICYSVMVAPVLIIQDIGSVANL